MDERKITAIIQVRMGSTRLPNKAMLPICGKPFIWHVVERLKHSKRIGKIVLATTTNPKDDALAEWGAKNGISVFRGSEEDVLFRYFEAAKAAGAKYIARITADDPFKDPSVIDAVAEMFFEKKLDFAYNNRPPSFPEGLDSEIFTFAALEKAAEDARESFEREHVTQYFYRHPEIFNQGNLRHNEDLSHLRWTVDTKEDFAMAKEVYRQLYKEGKIFLMEDILALLAAHPQIARMNSEVKRSDMYRKNK